MVCLCFGYQKDTLVLYAKNVDDEVEIIDSSNDYELIKINREKLEKFINTVGKINIRKIIEEKQSRFEEQISRNRFLSVINKYRLTLKNSFHIIYRY